MKHERERRRYSQNELAKLVGISQALLSKIEAEKTPVPGGEVVKRLAKLLWVTTDYLLGWTRTASVCPLQSHSFGGATTAADVSHVLDARGAPRHRKVRHSNTPNRLLSL